MRYSTRRLNRRSLSPLAGLASRYGGASGEWTADALAGLLAERRGYYVAGARGSRRLLLGYAIGRYAWGKLHVVDIAVRPDARRRGVGGQLMSHLIAHARRSQLAEVYLEVRSTNVPALALYRSLGFRARFLLPGLADGEDVYALYLPIETHSEEV